MILHAFMPSRCLDHRIPPLPKHRNVHFPVDSRDFTPSKTQRGLKVRWNQ